MGDKVTQEAQVRPRPLHLRKVSVVQESRELGARARTEPWPHLHSGATGTADPTRREVELGQRIPRSRATLYTQIRDWTVAQRAYQTPTFVQKGSDHPVR